jgi:ketosteroid isomerase-like protein
MSMSRRSLLAVAGKLCFTLGLAKANSATAQPASKTLVARAAQAHEALMRGDIEHYRSLMTLGSDFTLMAPFGGAPSRGGRYTEEQWAAIGHFFRDGRDSTFELVHAYDSADLTVLAAIERSYVAVGNLPAQLWALRVTLVFRKEAAGWVLVHRHADPLAGGVSVAESAHLASRASAR